ncbi:hypothetical protein JTB14_030592 [Gonioctena quinquepunctata]|nr:hypothetical protein JTB14_030592 [Gonioctena quinquepunctata]
MSMEQPLVGTTIPSIPEESNESTPVVPRRKSSTKSFEKFPVTSNSEPGDSEKISQSESSEPNPAERRRSSGTLAKLVKQKKVDGTVGFINNGFSTDATDVATLSSVSGKASVVDERLAERRKSFVPMSSMEEENLRERLYLAQLKLCTNIVNEESKYSRETFRRLFQLKETLADSSNCL